MKHQDSQMSQGTLETVKKKVATEILFIQKTALYSFVAGVILTIFCIFLFNPWKFDGEKYRKIKGNTQVNPYTNTVYSPLWWSDGFYDYCDRNVSFNPYIPFISYQERKNYLYRKAFKIGLIVWLVGVGAVLLYRYGMQGQKWVNENAS